jgi:hypothetical protein
MERKRSESGFRLILFVGAFAAVVVGVWGLVWIEMLRSVLGFRAVPRAAGIIHVFGGVMISIGVTYALAAAQPQRNRSLLVPLFLVPATIAVTVIAGVARGEIFAGRGIGYALFNVAYCLLFFRLYPRVAGPEPDVNTSRNAEP